MIQHPQTVPYEAFRREREKRIAAEQERDTLRQERDTLRNEIFTLRKIRRAPALKPTDSAVLEEFRHVEKWGKVHDSNGNTRANYSTIAKNLHIAGDTVARSANRLEKYQLVHIHEHEGPEDEHERKYVHVREDRIAIIDKIERDEKVTPKQGGNRYLCTKCDSTDVDVRTITRKVTSIRCNNPNCTAYHIEKIVEDTGDEDSGWKAQNGHKKQKAQKQLAFEKKTEKVTENQPAGDDVPAEPLPVLEESAAQNAAHIVYTEGNSIPEELKVLEQWACHRGKEPYNARPGANNGHAKVNDPTTWTTYEQAQSLYEESQGWILPYDGIGFMLTKNDPYTVLDYDHCCDAATGEITSDQVLRQIAYVDSYAEFSLSGTGIHQFARASIPRAMKRLDIEMYDHVRFMVMTGKHLPGTPRTIEDRQEQIAVLYAAITPITAREPRIPCVSEPCGLSEEQILMKARNGKYREHFISLFDEGKWKHFTKIDTETGEVTPRYPTQNEADLGLCRSLAIWCDNDATMIDTLFRQSALFRSEKWDRGARSGETYGQGTIRMALGDQGRIAS